MTVMWCAAPYMPQSLNQWISTLKYGTGTMSDYFVHSDPIMVPPYHSCAYFLC